MVTSELNTWGELDLQKSNVDEETEICIGDEGDKHSIPPTNYLHISRYEDPVEENFILDLSLPPPPLPAGVASDTDRKNLTLHTTGGRVSAEIWIRHDGRTKPKRVSMDLYSGNGFVRAIVHDPSSSSDRSSRALPFLDMKLCANYGDVYISLPRCFRGPITVRTGDHRITFSPAFAKRAALMSDVSGVRVYFVGDRPHGGKWGDGDNGERAEEPLDELMVDGRYSSVRINWDGEEEVPIVVPNGWQVFCGGAERFFTSGRVR